MTATFAALDKRITRDTEALHDHLWHPGWKGDANKLRASLVKDARDADAFLRMGGRLRRNAVALADVWGQPGEGESLFELLEHTWGLAAATVHLRKGEYRRAAERAKNVISSASIGVCANAGCFEFVQEWEAGKIDFEAYTGKLADFLDSKGVANVGQFKRMLNAVHEFHRNWNSVAGREGQISAGRAAVAGAGWCLLTSVSIRERIGTPPRFNTKDFAAIVERIVARM